MIFYGIYGIYGIYETGLSSCINLEFICPQLHGPIILQHPKLAGDLAFGNIHSPIRLNPEALPVNLGVLGVDVLEIFVAVIDELLPEGSDFLPANVLAQGSGNNDSILLILSRTAFSITTIESIHESFTGGLGFHELLVGVQLDGVLV